MEDVGYVALGRQLPRDPGEIRDRLPYLRVANVQDDELVLDDLKEMSLAADEQERYAVLPGDILLCEGQSIELVGRCALYRGELERVLFQNTLIRFRPHPGIDPEYVLLVFRAFHRDGTFSRIARSTTNLAHLGLSRFKQLPFPLAPTDVQAMLGSSARAAQDQIDFIAVSIAAATAHAERLCELIRHQAILGDRSPSRLSVSQPLPDLPRGWRWESAANVVEEDAPIVYGILQPGPDAGPDVGIPYVRGTELRDGYILTDELRHTTPEIGERYTRSSLRAGDVLVGLVRNPRVALVPPELEGGNITQGVRASARAWRSTRRSSLTGLPPRRPRGGSRAT